MSDALTPEQLAERLQLDVQSIRRGLRDGTIPGYRIGTRWRTPLPAYERWLRCDDAEAALPEGWTLHGVRRGYVGAAATPNGPRWSATAQQSGLSTEVRRHGTVPNRSGTGPTPAAALRALAARLTKEAG